MAVPVYADGVTKIVVLAPETVFGTAGAGPGQQLRRVNTSLVPTQSPIESQEIASSAQVRNVTTGPRSGAGTISGELAPATYKSIFEGLLRGTWAAGITAAAITDSVITIDGVTGNLILTSPTSHFVTTSLFKLGDMLKITGATGAGLANNGELRRVVAITDTVITFAPPLVSGVTWASGQTISLVPGGKKLVIPASGNQVKRSYTIEESYPVIGRYDLALGARWSQASINMPAQGYVTFQAQYTSRDASVENASQQYTTPTGVSTSGALQMVGGQIVYNGVPMTTVTQASLQVAVDVSADPVAGMKIVPEIFTGMIRIRGSFSCFYTTDTLTADFLASNPVSLAFFMSVSRDPTADFFSIFMPRVILTSSSKTDSSRAIMRSFNFAAEELLVGTGVDLTTIVLQDSLA